MSHPIKYHLGKLLEAQLETLADQGVAGRIIRKLESKKHQLLDGQETITIDSLPFLPVIPFVQLDLEQQIVMVGHARHPGINKLQETDIIDLEPADEPYFITQINEGDRFLGKSSRDVTDYFLQCRQHPLTAGESLALAMHTNILQRHNIIAINSNYKIGDEIVLLCLNNHQPVLKHANVRFADNTYAIPFYQKRV